MFYRTLFTCIFSVIIAVLAPIVARSQGSIYQGPLPRITSGFGATGTFTVDTLRFPAFGWEGVQLQTPQEVLVFAPLNASSPRPTVLFAHGYGGFDVRFYAELLHHIASRGNVAVFVPYPISLNFPALYRTLDSGFAEAVRRFPMLIDSTRIGFMGHSFGGGAIPSIAYKAYTERLWGRNGKFLFPMAPWYALETTQEMLRAFPPDTKLIMQIYRDDRTNDHLMAMDVFRAINIANDEKDFITVLPDTVNGYIFSAGHGLCNTANSSPNGASFDGYDIYAVFRLLDALMEYTFALDGSSPSKSAAKNVALGNGSPEQVFMGMVGNRALKPLHVTDAPTPDPLAPRAQFACANEINPRRDFCSSITSVAAFSTPPNPTRFAANIALAPQPAGAVLRIALPETMAHITPAKIKTSSPLLCTVYNMLGQEILRSLWQETPDGNTTNIELTLDISSLPQGVYVCRIQHDGHIFSQTFVRQL